MNNNNQLIKKAQTEITTNFQKELATPICQFIQNKSYDSSWKSWFDFSPTTAYYQLKINGTNLDYNIDQWIFQHASTTQDFQWNFTAITNFITLLEKEVKQQTFTILDKQLANSENGYLAIINALEHQNLEQIGDLQTMNDDKDLTIQAGLQEVDNLILENQQLKASLTALEEKLRPFTAYLSQSHQTAHFNASFLIQDNAGWTIEQLRERLAELQRLTTAYQANTILLESQINQLTNKVTIWEKKEVQWTEFYQKWEETKQKLLDRQNIERKRQKETIWENSQLITLISNLGCLLDDNHNDFQAFLTAKELEITSLKNLITQLNQNLSISQENLKTVRNAHFYAKVKYMSLLAIDTSRNLLPTKVGSLITSVETLIFGSEVTGFTTGSKVGWTLIGFLTIGIWLLGLWKLLIFSWTKSWRFYYLFKGRTKDFQAEIKNDYQQAKDAYHNPVNYAKSDLEKAKEAKEVIDIEINTDSNHTNSEMSKLSKEKKES